MKDCKTTGIFIARIFNNVSNMTVGNFGIYPDFHVIEYCHRQILTLMVWDLVEFLCCSILNRIFTLSILGYVNVSMLRILSMLQSSDIILMILNINISDFGCYQIFNAIELRRYSILTLNFDVDFWRYYVNLHSTDPTRYLSLIAFKF